MANKRQLKKQISKVCSDIAGDLNLATIVAPEIDLKKVGELLVKLARLHSDTLAKATFAFDKTPKDFADARAYHTARRAYFTTAYEKLSKSFLDQAIEIVGEINKLVPADVRKRLSEL